MALSLVHDTMGIVSDIKSLKRSIRVKVFNLSNRDDVRTLKATAVGNYIASRQLYKLTGQEIGLNVFYHN